ncbi:MAG: SCO family protein [Dehalococcoidia bacterium]|nr:SCO family protein [Dehalococcoidia bacterium]
MLRKTLAAALCAVAVLSAAACNSGDDDASDSTDPTASPTTTADRFRGGIVTPPFDKPDIVLTDTDGNPFDLRKETEGELTLLYIGYTHCPDICPTHMLEVADAMEQLGAEDAAKLNVVFITADPARDTPEVMRKWLDHFSTSFIGLTGTEEQINSVHDQLHMAHPTFTDLGDGNYAVSHAALVLAYTEDNVAPLAFPNGFELENWVHDLNKLIDEGWEQ